MPTSTDIKHIRNESENAEILKDSKGIKLYHSRDLEFSRPKASLIYKVFNNKFSNVSHMHSQ